MTPAASVTAAPARKPGALADEDRAAEIGRLARDCGDMPHGDVMDRLARLACPGLSPQRRAAMFGYFRDSRSRETALREGVAGWETEMPGLNPQACGDCQVAAADVFGDRAREAMDLLVHGEAAK